MVEHLLELLARRRGGAVLQQREAAQEDGREHGDRAELVGLRLLERLERARRLPAREVHRGPGDRHVHPGHEEVVRLARLHGRDRALRPGRVSRERERRRGAQARRRARVRVEHRARLLHGERAVAVERLGPGGLRRVAEPHLEQALGPRQLGGLLVERARPRQLAEERDRLGLCADQVELARASPAPLERRVRERAVAVHQRELVEQPAQRQRLRLARHGLLGGAPGVGEAVRAAVGVGQVRARERVLGVSALGLERLLDRAVVLAEAVERQRERVGRGGSRAG